MGKEKSFTIDNMRKEDVDQVLAIEQASFTSPWSRNLFLSEFRSPGVSSLLVALHDAPVRTVTGFIVYWVVQDEMHILNLAVMPAFRRNGLARMLVADAIRRAQRKGARRAFLEVRISNTNAQKLYSHLGFTGVSVRREYYDAPVEDAVVMMLDQGALQSLAGS